MSELEPVAATRLTPLDKVERDGMVAVIVSPGFGEGWSTWSYDREAAVFAPDVVAWIEAGKPADAALLSEWQERYGYLGGLRDVEIEWVPKGARFVIDEYDGSESLTILGPDHGYVA